ncbi:MAG: hypothetical protein KYX69_21195 [Sphingomonas sp.]|uniref:hypothetical protein n=1 Tax=Sphingomonas sp. TaxID=28214 RepID=UPI00261BADAD|nr:hypothetical protein [Sphingomonas sp.]MDK2770222.1 hypothetical protein [Sphingomonas sp.]
MATTTISVPGEPGNIAIMAAIGHVCLQWSRLEMAVLGLLVTIEPMEFEKGTLMFGGLDLLPRLSTAISLARYHKLPLPIVRKIEAIRKELQKGGLAERRNQAVHGAHRDLVGFETTLTMVRFKGDKRSQRITAQSINQIAEDAHRLGDAAWSLMEEIRDWTFARDIRAEETG